MRFLNSCRCAAVKMNETRNSSVGFRGKCTLPGCSIRESRYPRCRAGLVPLLYGLRTTWFFRIVLLLPVGFSGLGCGGLDIRGFNDTHQHGAPISGRLINEKGEGLPGVAVYAYRENGTLLEEVTTDLQGNYSVKGPGEPIPTVIVAWPQGFLATYVAQASPLQRVPHLPAVHPAVDFTFNPVEPGTISATLEPPALATPQPFVFLKQFFHVNGVEKAFLIGYLNWIEGGSGNAKFALGEGRYLFILGMASDKDAYPRGCVGKPGTEVEVIKGVETKVAFRRTLP